MRTHKRICDFCKQEMSSGLTAPDMAIFDNIISNQQWHVDRDKEVYISTRVRADDQQDMCCTCAIKAAINFLQKELDKRLTPQPLPCAGLKLIRRYKDD